MDIDKTKKRRLKIAFYSHSFPPEVDGVSRRFSGIVNELHAQGHECFLFTLEKEPRNVKYSGFCTLEFTTVALYPMKRLGSPSLANFAKIMSALKAEQPDIIHVVSDATTMLFSVAGKMLGIPVVVSIHTDTLTFVKAIGAHSVAWMTVSKDLCEAATVDSVATTSPSFSATLKGRGIQCSHIMRTAVDVNLFNPCKFDATTRQRLMFGQTKGLLAVYVGRLSPEKGILELIDWVSKVDGVYLAIIGDGPMSSSLIKYHDPNKRVYCQPQFVGPEQVATILASADVHVSSSTFETLGNTVLEAHACGIPVIVPIAAGFVDTVHSTVDGYLFDPKTPSDASEFLKRLRDDQALTKRMGANGRKKVLQNTIQSVTQDLMSWYRRSMMKWKDYPATKAIARCAAAVWMTIFMVFCVHVYFCIESICLLLLRQRVVEGYQINSRFCSWTVIVSIFIALAFAYCREAIEAFM